MKRMNRKPRRLEKDIQNQILDFLTIKGIFCWRQNNGALKVQGIGRPDRFVRFSCPGVSDILGCYRGRFLAIEVKRPGNKPTPDQRVFLKNIANSGGIAIVAYSVEDVMGALNNG